MIPLWPIPRWTGLCLAAALALPCTAVAGPEPTRENLRGEQIRNSPVATAGLEEDLGGPEEIDSRLRAFGLTGRELLAGMRVDTSQLPEQDWTMNGIRPAEKGAVFEYPKIPLARLAYPVEQLPAFWGGITSEAVYLGFVEGRNHPVVVKIFRRRAQSLLDGIREMTNAQIFDRLGVGPRFYGLVELEDGRKGYAMQLIPGKEAQLVEEDTPDVIEISSRLRNAGLSLSSLIRTPSGRLVVYDAGNALTLDVSKRSEFIQSSTGLEEEVRKTVRRVIAKSLHLQGLSDDQLDQLADRPGDAGQILRPVLDSIRRGTRRKRLEQAIQRFIPVLQEAVSAVRQRVEEAALRAQRDLEARQVRWERRESLVAVKEFLRGKMKDLRSLREAAQGVSAYREEWAAMIDRFVKARGFDPERDSEDEAAYAALIGWLNLEWFTKRGLFLYGGTSFFRGHISNIAQHLYLGEIEEERRYEWRGNTVQVYLIHPVESPSAAKLMGGLQHGEVIFLRVDSVREEAETQKRFDRYDESATARFRDSLVSRGVHPAFFRQTVTLPRRLKERYPDWWDRLEDHLIEHKLAEELRHWMGHLRVEEIGGKQFVEQKAEFYTLYGRNLLGPNGTLRALWEGYGAVMFAWPIFELEGSLARAIRSREDFSYVLMDWVDLLLFGVADKSAQATYQTDAALGIRLLADSLELTRPEERLSVETLEQMKPERLIELGEALLERLDDAYSKLKEISDSGVEFTIPLSEAPTLTFRERHAAERSPQRDSPIAAGLEEETLAVTIREFLGKRERERKFRVPARGLAGGQSLNFRQLFALLVQKGLLDYTHHLNIERELVFIERKVRTRNGWDSVMKIYGSPLTNSETNRLDPFARVEEGDRITLTSKVLASRKRRKVIEGQQAEREYSLAPTAVRRRGDVVEVRLLDTVDLELFRDSEEEEPAPLAPPVAQQRAAIRRIRTLFRQVAADRSIAVGVGPTLAGEHAKALGALAPILPGALRREMFVITPDATLGRQLAARGLNASSEAIVVVQELDRRLGAGTSSLYYHATEMEKEALADAIRMWGAPHRFEVVPQNGAMELRGFLQQLLAALLKVEYRRVPDRVNMERLVRDVELLIRA